MAEIATSGSQSKTDFLTQPTNTLTERDKILLADKDKSNWEWVEIPARDLFDEVHCGVSINFDYFGPEKDDNNNYTGNPGRYFVAPSVAVTIRKLLQNKVRQDMRILQPTKDKVAMDIMARNGSGGGRGRQVV